MVLAGRVVAVAPAGAGGPGFWLSTGTLFSRRNICTVVLLDMASSGMTESCVFLGGGR